MSSTEEKEMAEKTEHRDWLPTKTLYKTVVIDEGGNCLVSKRAKNDWDTRAGKWDINGGALEEKDVVVGLKPHEVTIKREVLEESGLEVEFIENVGFYDSGVKVSSKDGNIPISVNGFKCRIKGVKPEVKLNPEEHTESKWVTLEEALTLDFGNDGNMCKDIIQLAFK